MGTMVWLDLGVPYMYVFDVHVPHSCGQFWLKWGMRARNFCCFSRPPCPYSEMHWDKVKGLGRGDPCIQRFPIGNRTWMIWLLPVDKMVKTWSVFYLSAISPGR